MQGSPEAEVGEEVGSEGAESLSAEAGREEVAG